jgi:predicted dehydrogenase
MTSQASAPLGMAVIGVGFMGELHTRVISELAQTRLVAVADVRAERAREVAERYGAETWTADYASLLDDDRIEAVSVCTSDNIHREPAEEALASGRHVLLEKPIASTLEDADAIIAAAEQTDRTLMVGHIYRFEVHYVKLRQAVESGHIGKPLSFYSRQSTILEHAELVAGRVGVSFYISVHSFDLMSWYLGQRPVSIYSVAAKAEVFERFGVPDGVWSLVRFDQGAVGCEEAFWNLAAPLGNWTTPEDWGAFFSTADCRAELIGTRASAYIEYPPTVCTLLDPEGWKFAETKIAPIVYGRVGGALKLEIEHFVDCVRGRTQPVTDLASARQAVELAVAAERSIAEGGPVPLPLETTGE